MSRFGHDLRHGLGIARIELRRSLRKSFGTRKRQLTVFGFVALFSPMLVFWGRIAYSAGVDAAIQGTFPVETLGIQLSLLAVVFVVMGALRVVKQGRPDGDSLLLTATTPRAVLVGTTIHATIQLVGFALLPTLLFAGSFALGTGRPLLFLTAVLAVIPLFTAISMVGTVLGQAVVLGLLRSRVLRSASRAFGLVLLIALMGLSYAAMAPVMGAAGPLEPLAFVAAPGTLYLAFVFFGAPFGPAIGVGSLLVGAAVVASIPAAFAVANRLAPRLWFADATPAGLMQRDTSSAKTASPVSLEETADRPESTFPPRTGPRPLSVAIGLWIRWIRIPVRFSALFPLVIVLVTALFGAINDPESLPFVGGGVLVFAGVYVAGAVFGLNPLGEAGQMRTIESLSATRPQTLVLGHVTAGLLGGLPLAIAGALTLTIAAGVSLPMVGLAVGLAVVVTVTSASVAVGIGTMLPSADETRTYRGYEVATPSQWTLVAFMAASMLLVGITAIGAVVIVLPGISDGLPALRLAIPTVVAVLLLAAGYGGYRTATNRFGRPLWEA